jgi:prepilin-type N-terminal cleavage/methylation domain-containing protein
VIGRRPGRGGEAGFSLVELVVVVAIGGLLLALAFNGSSLTANRRLTGMARKIAGDMRMVEQRARTERTCYRIVFDPSGESYSIHRYDGTVIPAPLGGGSQCTDSTAWSSTPVVVEEAGDTVSRRMPRPVDLVSAAFGGDATLVFSPLGNPEAGTATLQTPSGQQKQIVIEAMGRVRILP